MKLIQTESKEEVRIGDSLYYDGLSTERYTFIGIQGDFIKASRHGKTTFFSPSIFKCEIIDDSKYSVKITEVSNETIKYEITEKK